MVSSTIAVYNGEEAARHQFPFIASLRIFENNVFRHNCGASIITDRFVLTAAHCNGKISLDNYRIAVGIHTRIEDGDQYQLEQFVNHQNFTQGGNINNDIALILLKEKIRFSQHVTSIPIARNFIPENLPVISAGWGMSLVCYLTLTHI